MNQSLAKAEVESLATPSASFEPSEAQVALLKHMQSKGYDCNISDACAECEVGRRTWYNWAAIDAFRDWWQEQADKYFHLQLPKVKAAATRAALERAGGQDRKHSPQAIKLFLERFDKGYAPRTRTDIIIRTFEQELQALEKAKQTEPPLDDHADS